MGLTANSTGFHVMDYAFVVKRQHTTDKVIALAGNPNVGKSTVFNSLTGLNQHTGNWPGKTISNAQGKHNFKGTDYIFVDLPGTYSLISHSSEEEIARDFICFGGSDAVVVVCDATCFERNLNLVLQTIEITPNVVVCINLLDEAAKKNIKIDFIALEKYLGVPVVGTTARSNNGLVELVEKVDFLCDASVSNDLMVIANTTISPIQLTYSPLIEEALSLVDLVITKLDHGKLNSRWISLKLIENDSLIIKGLEEYLGIIFMDNDDVKDALANAKALFHREDAVNCNNSNEHILQDRLSTDYFSTDSFKDQIVSSLIMNAEKICSEVVSYEQADYHKKDRLLDRLLTSRLTGIPIMLALLCLILWITIIGSNIPSQLLSSALFWFQDRLTELFLAIGIPLIIHDILVLGVYRVLAWVIAVMLPPMAIFFPLFTLLEDFGYLPRVAFNLDYHFKKCCACGKQALTMCMGNINV